MTPSPSDDPWTAARFEQALLPFFEEHAELRTDPTARAPQHTRVTKTGRGTWDVVQVLCDAEGDDDWMLDGDRRPGGLGQGRATRTSDARR